MNRMSRLTLTLPLIASGALAAMVGGCAHPSEMAQACTTLIPGEPCAVLQPFYNETSFGRIPTRDEEETESRTAHSAMKPRQN